MVDYHSNIKLNFIIGIITPWILQKSSFILELSQFGIKSVSVWVFYIHYYSPRKQYDTDFKLWVQIDWADIAK